MEEREIYIEQENNQEQEINIVSENIIMDGSVTDVTVNGTSVVQEGIAEIDLINYATKDYTDNKIEEVESIAKGANQAVSFGNYYSMISVFNALGDDVYNKGQNIMIVTLEVPDLWVSDIVEESIEYVYTSDEDLINLLKEQGYIQIGYYKLSQLETQKVDLTDYVKKTDAEYTVKKALSNNSLEWTDEEKDSARELLNCAKNQLSATSYQINKYVGTPGLFLYDGGAVGGLFRSTAGGNVPGAMRIKKASYKDIDNRTANDYHDAGVGTPNYCCPITPANSDYLVKAVLTNPKIEWTDEEKQTFKTWLGL